MCHFLRFEDRNRIAARETGNAVAQFGVRVRIGYAGSHGVQEALDREVHETVGAEVSRELCGPEMVRDQLVARRDVDAHVTRVLQRRRRDPQVHLQCARLPQHRHDRLYAYTSIYKITVLSYSVEQVLRINICFIQQVLYICTSTLNNILLPRAVYWNI